MKKLLLIKYGELTTKKGNRKTFIKLLVKNIQSILMGEEYQIHYDRVRMYIESESLEAIEEKLVHVFGIHSIVECYQVHTNMEEISSSLVELLKKVPFQTFKVETKRADKSFPIENLECSRQLGGVILKNIPCKVDVHHPDLTVKVEIRREGTFLYVREIPGIGGYPVGIQGKGLLMLSGGIDSPVAGYLSLKRGVDLECLYFESPPHTSLEAKNKVVKLASIINAYSGNLKVLVVPFTKLQEAIYKNVPESYVITIMRRMMYRIATEVVKRRKLKIILNGESIGQVASQTLDSMRVINSVTTIPVIRPVACMDKLELIEISKKIGTYETSILPYEDCCTIFLPKHPVINPELEKCIEYESRFDYETLLEECVSNIEVISLKEQKKDEDDLL